MTFYEAALRILEAAGQPLPISELTQKALEQNLLSHVGKQPELTMLSRLAAMARRPRDRKVIVVAKDTFALADWNLPEDPEALAQTGIPAPNPEEDLPPLRPPERHPEARVENVRAAGRGERRRRHEDDDRHRKRRFPALADVAFELLSDAQVALACQDLIDQARSRDLVPERLGVDDLLTALLEDNLRRIDGGRKAQFLLDGATRSLSLARGDDASAGLEALASFAQVLELPVDNGRPVLRRAPPAVEAGVELAGFQAARTAVKEARRAMARALRQRLAEEDGGTFEKACVKVLHAMHFRELKVAKRSKEGPLLTARRREGSVELRYAVRLLRGTTVVDRRTVHDLRKDLGHHSAQVGLICCAGELRGDARSEAQTSGPLVLLWCGEALADKFLDSRIGVEVQQVELFELDEAFFEQMRVDAEAARQRREERHRDRQSRESVEQTGSPATRESSGPPTGEADATEPQSFVLEDAFPKAPNAAQAPDPFGEGGDEGDEDEEGDEGPEADLVDEGADPATSAAAQPSQPGQGERKRRRRRRRGRRGRGSRPQEGAAPGLAAPAEGEAPAQASTPAPRPEPSGEPT